MNLKAVAVMALLAVAGIWMWKSGMVGGSLDTATTQSSASDAASSETAQKGKALFEQWKYPAISMGIILVILAAAWKHTPPIVKYPLVTLIFVGWVYFSGR